MPDWETSSLEHRAWNRDGFDVRFGDALGGRPLIGQQAGGGENAAFAARDAVKHDLAAALGNLLHAHCAFGQKQQRLRLPALAEQHRARLDVNGAGPLHKGGPHRFIQRGKAGEVHQPAARFSGGFRLGDGGIVHHARAPIMVTGGRSNSLAEDDRLLTVDQDAPLQMI